MDRVTKKDRRNESEDDSEQERQDQKELDRLLEKSEKLKERLDKRKGSAATRRVRSDLFEEGRMESEFMDLQREWTRGENSRDSRPSKESRDWSRSLRRVKSDNTYSPPTRGTSGICPLESSWLEGRKTYSSIREAVGSRRSIINLQDQDEEGRYVPQMVGYGDFRGYHLDNPESNYRALIKRIKEGQISDPTMKGKFLNQPRAKWMSFCCDTGCSTNLMPVKMAALNGLKYSPLDPNEPQYRSVTNQKLEIVGQTYGFVKLEKVNRPVKL